MNTSPWHSLTPDFILTEIEKILGKKLGSVCLMRNSYINRVYESELADTHERVIAKFYRPNRWPIEWIQDEHRLLNTLAASDIPVICPLNFNGQSVTLVGEIPVAIFPKKGGRAIDELTTDQWQEAGRLLARLHTIAKPLSTNRLIWRPAVATQGHLQTLQSAECIPAEYQTIAFKTVEKFIQKADTLFQNVPLQLIHGDCHLGNLIFRPGESLHIVDFDDCAIGPVIQDMWMVFPEDMSRCPNELDHFITGYNTFSQFPHQQLKLVPALRAMRQVHFAAWCAIQKNDPHFRHHFPEWGTPRYWNEWIKSLNRELLEGGI